MTNKAGEITARYRHIIFDLDNTLYNERTYLYAAYRHIAEKFSADYNVDRTGLEDFLITEFETAGRTGLFDKALNRFSLPPSAMQQMLYLMRTVSIHPKIELFDKVKPVLQQLADMGWQWFVITNGNVQQQKNKVSSINWNGLNSHISFVYANEFKPKPDTAPFEHLVAAHRLNPAQTIYIGDTESDLLFAQNCGISFMHIDNLLG